MFNYLVPVSVNSASNHASVCTCLRCHQRLPSAGGIRRVYPHCRGTAAELPCSRCQSLGVPQLLHLPEQLGQGVGMWHSAEASLSQNWAQQRAPGERFLALAPSFLPLRCKITVAVASSYLEPKLPPKYYLLGVFWAGRVTRQRKIKLSCEGKREAS